MPFPADMTFRGTSTCQLISMVNPVWLDQFRDTSRKYSLKRLKQGEYIDLKHLIGEMMLSQFLTMFPNLKSHVCSNSFLNKGKLVGQVNEVLVRG